MYRLQEEPSIATFSSFTPALSSCFALTDIVLMSNLYIATAHTLYTSLSSEVPTASVSLTTLLHTLLTSLLATAAAGTEEMMVDMSVVWQQVNHAENVARIMVIFWAIEMVASVIQQLNSNNNIPQSMTFFGYLKTRIHPMIVSLIGLGNDVFFLLLLNK